MTHRHHPLSRQSGSTLGQWAKLLLLTGLAWAGNYFSISLFYGVDFLFGSIAAFVIICCYGLAAGTVAAVLASTATLLLWHHPYGLVILSAEVLTAGFLHTRKRMNLILADCLFWILLGIPLIWLLYGYLMRVEAAVTLFVSLKQSANGIFNALIASLLVHYSPLCRRLGNFRETPAISLYDLLFHLMIGLVLLPTLLLMVINGRANVSNLQTRLRAELRAAANDISYHLYTRLQLHLHAVRTLAQITGNLPLTPSRPLQRITGLVNRSFPDFHNMYVANDQGVTVAFSPPSNRKGESTIGLDFSDRAYFHQAKATRRPVISDVFLGRGGIFEPIITLAVPILAENRFRGLAVGALDLSGLIDLLSSYAETKTMHIIVLDQQQQILATTLPLNLMSRYQVDRAQTHPRGKGFFRVQADGGHEPELIRGREAALQYRTSVAPDLNWTLILQAPLEPLQKALAGIYIRHLTLTLILVLVALLIAKLVSAGFTRSIDKLIGITNDLPARLLAGGQRIELSWPQPKTGELQNLVHNFQEMSHTLQRSFGELQDRTLELTRLNTALQEEIRERQRLTETVQRQKRLEAIGNLAASVAHDLNNILSGLVGWPDLILQELPLASPLRPKILRIRESGEKAAAVVQDLLTLARRGVMQTKILNVNAIITDLLESPSLKSLLLSSPQIRLQTDLDPVLPPISGSEVHLSKSLMNLVMNAMEAMPAGGEILILTANCLIEHPVHHFEQLESGGYVVLVVSDEGVGIAPQDLKRIFEPFYTKKSMGRSGTGLGMSVVWTTVKDLGGFLDVTSQEGEGTTFVLYFPVAQEDIIAGEDHIPLEEYLGKEKILVVDDAREQREIAAAMLGKLGYQVTTASSGEEALQLLQEKPFDLVVLDMVMESGLDGLETYRQMVALRPGQKAVIASGFAETDRVQAAQALGAGPYLAKPYTLEKLGLAVRKELDRFD